MPQDPDVIVIGSGTGGYACALRAAQLGREVTLVERDGRLGGTCLLRGCIPTKALLQSAAVMDEINRAERWGIKASGDPDWDGILAFQGTIVDKLVSGVESLLKARKVDVVRGTARLVSPTTIEVSGDEHTTLSAKDVVLATGSRPKLLSALEVSERVITSDQAVGLDRLPASAVVIGAGAVGLEFASLYRSFGAEVTVIEALPRLAPLEDEDASKEVARVFRRRGIVAHAGAAVAGVDESKGGVTVRFETSKGTREEVTAEICLVAVGREPVTDGLALDAAGVSLERGFVKVDGRLRTSAPGVWALGDVADTPLQLAHVAFTEGYAVAERIAGEEVPEIDYAGIPRVTYCSPEIASVGLTETQARERGHEPVVEKYSLQGLGKANIVGEGGLCKVIAEPEGAVLGVHMVGPHVTDLISEAMLITNWEAVPAEVAALIHPHPTLSEAIGEAHLALAGKPLHSL